MEHKDAVNIIKALRNLTMEVQLFREAFVANNRSICEDCVKNPCNKKVLLNGRRVVECSMFEPHIDGLIDKDKFEEHCLNCDNGLTAECTVCDGDKYFSEDGKA